MKTKYNTLKVCNLCNRKFEHVNHRTKIRNYSNLPQGYSPNRCNSCQTNHRRSEMKKCAVQYAGGSCNICNYSKCMRALSFHHVDPKTKKFDISRGTYAWKTLKKEIDKCILVCMNCHAELHDNITKMPTILKKSDKNPFQYKIKRTVINNYCKDCNKKITKQAKRCRPCSDKKRRVNRFDWPPVKKLLQMLSKSNYYQLGKKLGVSDNAIRKHLKKEMIS